MIQVVVQCDLGCGQGVLVQFQVKMCGVVSVIQDDLGGVVSVQSDLGRVGVGSKVMSLGWGVVVTAI